MTTKPDADKMSWIYPGSRFATDEFVAVTGDPFADRSQGTIATVAEGIARYNAINVVTSRHDAIQAHYEEVMAIGRANGSGPHLGGRILGPSGTGKTTAAHQFLKDYEARGLHAPGERPVLVVPLDRASTSRRLFSAILQRLGDGFHEKGTEEVLQKRACEGLRRLGVRLLIVDEVQHLQYRSTERNDTTDTLKRFLDDGVCPLVLIGTDDAAPFLNGNAQLANRLLPPCDLPPLLRSSREDRRVFRDYVVRLDAAMIDARLTRAPSGLDEKRTLSCLMEVSGGVLGRVSNLVRAALSVATARRADRIELCDLVAATGTWAIAQGLVPYCPWTRGIREPVRKRGAA